MLVRIHLEQIMEALLILERPEFRNILGPSSHHFGAQDIDVSYAGNDASKQVGPFRRGATHRNPSR